MTDDYKLRCRLCGFETDKPFTEVRHCNEHLINNIKCTHDIGCSDKHKCEPCKFRILLMTLQDGSIMDTETLESAIQIINKEFNYNFNSEWINSFDIIKDETVLLK